MSKMYVFICRAAQQNSVYDRNISKSGCPINHKGMTLIRIELCYYRPVGQKMARQSTQRTARI